MRIIYNNAINESIDKQWLVTITLSNGQEVGIKVTSNDYDNVNKSAEQYIRVKQQESSDWDGATVETIMPINTQE